MTEQPRRPVFADIVAARIGRRQAVTGLGLGAAAALLSGTLGVPLGARMALAAGAPSTLTFTEADHVIGAGLQVATPVGPLAADLAINPSVITSRGAQRELLKDLWREPPVRFHLSLGAL